MTDSPMTNEIDILQNREYRNFSGDSSNVSALYIFVSLRTGR